MVPGFIRFSALAFNQVLQALRNERLQRSKKVKTDDVFTFANTLDYRAARVAQRWRIDDGFSTDSVSARIDQFPGSKEHQRQKKFDSTQKRVEGRKRARNLQSLASHPLGGRQRTWTGCST